MGSDLVTTLKKMQWRWSVVLIMVLGASATFDDERLLTTSGRRGGGGNKEVGEQTKAYQPSAAGREEEFGEDDEDDELAGLGRGSGCRPKGKFAMTPQGTYSSSPGYEVAEFKASKSTAKKMDWITQTDTTQWIKSNSLPVSIIPNGELAVAGAGEILVAKAAALPCGQKIWDITAIGNPDKPERKALIGKTSDNKDFWATSFVGNLQIDTDTKGAAIQISFVKMTICKTRSSSNGCEDSTELEDAAATQEFEKVQQRLKNRRGSRRLLDSQAKKKAAGFLKEAKKVVAGAKKEAADTKNVEGGSESKVPSNVKSMAAAEKKAAEQSSGDSTCCTIKKMIHHCKTRKSKSASFEECDAGGKVLAGMIV